MPAEITPLPNGPLKVRQIESLRNDRGDTLSTAADLFLCRCGQSKNKPYCDGAHKAVNFSDRRERPAPPPPREFVGRELTIVDDFSLCAHAGECVDGAPDTFFVKGPDGRASLPDTTPFDQVAATIRKCPSGSLLYKVNGQLVADYATTTGIRAEKDGPLHVSRARLNGEARPATENHYTLCRCGASANKPFCDGTHSKVAFKAD